MQQINPAVVACLHQSRHKEGNSRASASRARQEQKKSDGARSRRPSCSYSTGCRKLHTKIRMTSAHEMDPIRLQSKRKAKHNKGGVGVGKVGGGATGHEHALISRVEPHASVACTAGLSKTPSAAPPCARSNGTPSAAGPFGVAADSASVPAPPGVSPSPRLALSPDQKKSQSHTLVLTPSASREVQHFPMRPNQ